MRRDISFSLISNALFIIPAIIAIQKSLFAYAALLVLAMIVSIIYHASNEKILAKTDRLFAVCVIFANLTIFYLSGFSEPYFMIALVFVFIAFYKDECNHEVRHSSLCSLPSTFSSRLKKVTTYIMDYGI